jgi:hypothetical protein
MDTSRIDSSLLNIITSNTITYNVKVEVKEKLSDEDLLLWENQGIDLLFMNSSILMKGLITWDQLNYLSEYPNVKIIKSNAQVKNNTHNLRKIKPSVLFDSLQTGNKQFEVLVTLNRSLTLSEESELVSKEIYLIPKNDRIFTSNLNWTQLDFLSNFDPILSIRPNLKKDISIIDISPVSNKKQEIKVREYNPARVVRPTQSGSGSGNNSSSNGSGFSN